MGYVSTVENTVKLQSCYVIEVGIPHSGSSIPRATMLWHDLKLQHGSSNKLGIEEPFRLTCHHI